MVQNIAYFLIPDMLFHQRLLHPFPEGGPLPGLKKSLIGSGQLVVDIKVFDFRRMSRIRQPSEWGIGKVKTLFSYLEYRRNLRILSMPLSKMFLIASHLTNIHTTIYGSQVS